jgi:4-amino-4-deoxy-L-arabinose transferase-like glycosyltransferase
MSLRPRTALALILAGALVARLWFWIGISGGDDARYASAAQDLVRGEYRPVGPFDVRLGMVLPMAAFRALLGPHEAAYDLPALLASMALIVLAYRVAATLLTPRAGLVAAALVAFLPMHTHYSVMPWPDAPVALATGWGVWLLLRPGDAPPRAFGWSGLCAGLSYLVRGGTWFPVALVALGVGVPRRRWASLGLWAAAFAGTVAAETVLFAILTGDPWRRFGSTDWTYESGDGARGWSAVRRILLAYPAQFFNPLHQGPAEGAGFLLFGGLPALALVGLGDAWRRRDPVARPLVAWMLAVYVPACLRPALLWPYAPYPVALARHLLPAAIPAAVIAAAFWSRGAWRTAGSLTAFLAFALFANSLLSSDVRSSSLPLHRASAALERAPGRVFVDAVLYPPLRALQRDGAGPYLSILSPPPTSPGTRLVARSSEWDTWSRAPDFGWKETERYPESPRPRLRGRPADAPGAVVVAGSPR